MALGRQLLYDGVRVGEQLGRQLGGRRRLMRRVGHGRGRAQPLVHARLLLQHTLKHQNRNIKKNLSLLMGA